MYLDGRRPWRRATVCLSPSGTSAAVPSFQAAREAEQPARRANAERREAEGEEEEQPALSS